MKDLRKQIRTRKRWDAIFAACGLVALMIGVLTFVALFLDMAIDGAGRLSWEFFTNFPSRRPGQAGILSAWVGSTLVFRATPLARVAAEIERHYDVAIDLEDASLQEMTVTATFTEQDVEEVLFVVCQIVGAGCTEESGRYRIGDASLGTLEPSVLEQD